MAGKVLLVNIKADRAHNLCRKTIFSEMFSCLCNAGQS